MSMEVSAGRPRAASVPARLELLDGYCWERPHTQQQVAPRLAVTLSSTFGPRDSSEAPAPHCASSPALALAPKRQASPAATAPLAKKASGARAWSPYHAYCPACMLMWLATWCRLGLAHLAS